MDDLRRLATKLGFRILNSIKKHPKIFIGIISGIIIGILFWNCLPAELFNDDYSFVITDKEDILLGAKIADDEQWRFPPIKKVPQKFIRALLTYEDKRFYYHPGVDPISVMRAVKQNITSKRIVSGASTISMQVIRLSRKKQRTFFEKIIEMIMAVRLEITTTKPTILKYFASHAPFGGNIVGLEAASWRYFGREPSKLSWAESAMLAVLPNSPALIHPGKNRSTLLRKRNFVLKKLFLQSFIDEQTYKLAIAEPLPPKPFPIPMVAPHLLFTMKKEYDKDIHHKAIIKTTIDYSIQQKASQVINRHHKLLKTNSINNACCLIMEVDTGNVIAYVGNVPDLDRGESAAHVDIIPSPRSTGSILKPILYAAMVTEGELLPAQLVPDIPTTIGGFIPQNFTQEYQGAVPAYMALARSLNIPAVRMLNNFGIDRFYVYLKRLGMTTLFRNSRDYGLSLIIGGAEGNVRDITAIYAGIARSVNMYSTIPDYNEPVFFPPVYTKGVSKPAHEQESMSKILSPGACYLTLQAMLEVERPGSDNAWRDFDSSQKIAWKTGTSQGFKDAWAVGVTPLYAVGVWVGNADGEGRPDLIGGKTAAPILFDLFDFLDKSEWFNKPRHYLKKTKVCAKSGFIAGLNCEDVNHVEVPTSSIIYRSCPYCSIVHLDPGGQYRVNNKVERVANMIKRSWFVLPPRIEWYYRRMHSDYQLLPPFKEDNDTGEKSSRLHTMGILFPDEGSKIYIPLDLDGKRGKTVFQAVHRRAGSKIYWHLDEKYLGTTIDIHHLEISPSPGHHTLTLVDEKGVVVKRGFTILDKNES